MTPIVETTARGESIHLYIESPGKDRSARSPNFFVSRLGLAVYGRWLLTRRGEIEMSAIGLVLSVIFLFDWMAWSLLFNAILHSEILALTPRTIFATLAGALFAVTVIIYERQFITSDTSQGWRKQWIPMTIRVCVIIAAALITAQPVELLFFREPIQQRIHEEGVRAHAIEIFKSFEGAQKKRIEADVMTAGIEDEWECRGRQETQNSLYAKQESAIKMQTQLTDAIGNREYWKRQVERLRQVATEVRGRMERMNVSISPGISFNDTVTASEYISKIRKELDEAEVDQKAAKKKYDIAASRVYEIQREIRETQLLIDVLDRRLTEAKTDCHDRGEEIETKSQEVETAAINKQQLLRNWIQTLATSVPQEVDGKSVVVGDVPFRYILPKYDFFAQLRVLYDLRHGAPPRWPVGSGEDMAKGAEEFGLTYPRNCDILEADSIRCTSEEKLNWESRQAEARHLRWAYVVVYGIAIVIPALVLALKFLLPTELISYYSITRQARTGNPEAQQILATMVEEN